MLAYIGTRRRNGKCEFGLTIWDDGKIVKSWVKREDLTAFKERYSETIESFKWGIGKIKVNTQNGALDDQEPLTICISSKTLIKWLEQEKAPDLYSDVFGDIMLNLSFTTNKNMEIMFSNTTKRVLFKNKDEEMESVADLFK